MKSRGEIYKGLGGYGTLGVVLTLAVGLGVHLAKRELKIVVEEFLTRFNNIRIKDGDAYRYHTGRTFGVDYLPLTWDK